MYSVYDELRIYIQGREGVEKIKMSHVTALIRSHKGTIEQRTETVPLTLKQ